MVDKQPEVSLTKQSLEDLRDLTLSRHVINVKTSAENISALLLDATRDLVAVADRDGMLFIHDYGDPQHPEISSFPISGNEQQSLFY